MTTKRRLWALIGIAGLMILGSMAGPDLRGQDKKGEDKKGEEKKGEEKKAAPPKAQPAPRGKAGKAETKAFTDAVTVPTNRDANRLIQAARDYIKVKDWRTAADCLQSLLETKEDSFIEVESKDDKGTLVKQRVSVRLEANRLIGELPPEGLESYQLQYGPTADGRLKEALEKSDPSTLAEVALRYLHTKAGAEATNLLGTYHLDRGSYLMAALSFERLLTRPDADKLPLRILYKAAIAFRRAGDPDYAEKLWKKITEKVGRGELMVGRQKVTIEQLRQEFESSTASFAQLGQSDWPVFRGNPARNAQGMGATSFLEPRWQTSMLSLDDTNPLALPEQKEATRHLRDLLPIAFDKLQGKPILPTFFPIAANGKLIYRSYDGVYAVSLKDIDAADGKTKAGELLWISPAQAGLHGMMQRADRRMTLEGWYKNANGYQNMGPPGVLFENSVIGSLSHDGQRVYFVDDLAVPPHPNMMQSQNINGQASFSPYDNEVLASRLIGVELETGKVLWIIGGRSTRPARDAEEKKDSPVSGQELLDSFFLGPPLPLGGKLYLMVEKNTEMRLVCLDPTKLLPPGSKDSSPEIVWQQSLGTANYKLPQDSLRRLQAAHLSYADGVLVCPTNAGLILGVDLLSHSLVWAHSYRDGQQSADDPNLPFGRIGRGAIIRGPGGMTWSPAQERWRPTAPIIQNGKVIFTAHDATAVHCLNLRDGRMLWHVPRKDDDLYLGGVFGNRVIIVGKTTIRALNLDDGGKELWSMPTGGMPSGQGAASNDIFYLPLQAVGEKKEPGILAINLASGMAVAPPARSRKKDPVGNLLFVEGELISQTALAVMAFPDLKRMLAEIDRRLKENPNDPIGLTERGELYLDKGELGLAVADFRGALTFAPPPETRAKARTKLHEALTDFFQNDFDAAEKYIEEYRELCKVDIPSDTDGAAKVRLADEQLRREANFLSLVGRGREKQGRLLDALAAYEEFGALTGNKELVSSIDERYTRSRPDVWSRGRIKGMIDRATPDQRKLLEAAIAKRWDGLRDKGEIDAVRKFVAVFGTTVQVGRDAQLVLAERLLAAGGPDDLTEAETKLQALCFSADLRKQDPTTAAKAIETMIRIYIRRGHYEDAVGFYKQLGTEFAKVIVRDGKTGADLLNELYTDKRFLPYLEPHGLSWRGSIKPQDSHGQFALPAMMTILPEGDLLPFFDRHRLVLDQSGGTNWKLLLLDRNTNEERWSQTNLPSAIYLTNNQAYANVNIAQKIMVAPNATGAQNHHFAFVKGHSLVLHLNNMVYAFDLSDRKEVWRHNLLGKSAPLGNNTQQGVGVDEDGRVFVISPDSRREFMGGVAVVESKYICLQTRVVDEINGGYREGLMALDPNRPGPSVLWTKSDVSLRAHVFGDDQYVYVVEPGGNSNSPTVRALRAEDGVSVPIADFGPLFVRRVRTVGRCLLLHDDEPQGGKTLRLYDVQTGLDIWRKSFHAGSIVIRSEDPSLTGVVQKDQSVFLLDILTGNIRFKTMIQAEHVDKLQSVALVTDRDRFYLALSHPFENAVQDWRAGTLGVRALQLNGPLYALNRTSGKLEWICDFLPHQALILERMGDLPVLLFTEYHHKRSPNGNMEQQTMRVTCVDKQTGKLIYDKDFGQPSLFLALRADSQAGVIELLRPDLKITFRLDSSPDANSTPPVVPTRPGRSLIR